MKVAIMQPYFAPYVGYMSLIKHSDQFILFDCVQFIRHGWIERNRILKQSGDWIYINVPLVKSPRETIIKDLLVNNNINWKLKIEAQLQPYKKIAPYYHKVIELIKTIFEQEYTSIVKLNQIFLEVICEYLGFPKKLEVFSEMDLNINIPTAADEWALNICKVLGNNITYINPIGGLEFFDRSKYEENNINIFFQKVKITSYDQKRETFEPALSIIDVLMFNSIYEINAMLDDYELI